MIVTKINLTPYLAEYAYSIYNNGEKSPVKIPDTSDLYHTIWQLMIRRPENHSFVDDGNFEIILPERRIGKDPQYFNYLSECAQKIIEKRIRLMFYAELHLSLLENENKGLLTRLEMVHQFMCNYNINSISEDALLKNYYRWRESKRKRLKRRDYIKKG